MSSLEAQKEIALHLVRNIAGGGIEDRYFADDMTAWTMTTGHIPKAEWQPKLARSKFVWSEPLVMTIDSVTAQPGRVVVQSRSRGVLITGVTYSNSYMFLVEFNDQGLIRHVREYFDVARLEAMYRPAVKMWEEQKAKAGA
jgi:ketosteroid isomerase-like protein